MLTFFSLGPSEQLNAYNSSLKEAARRVRNESLFKNPDGTEEKKLVLSSVFRAPWFNNLNLARKLMDFSVTAEEVIYIEDAQVKAHSFETFEVIFEDFFNVYHSAQVSPGHCSNEFFDVEEAIEVDTAACLTYAGGLLEERKTFEAGWY